ncbi:MAG: LamG domain-containing protein [Leptolyngbya sp. BL-A-14]
MTASQITETIATTLEAHIQDGLLILGDTTIAAVPLGKLFDLLNTGAQTLGFNHVTLAKADNTVTLTGQSSLLGADNIDLEAVFTDENGTVSFSVSAKHLPACHVPGTPWLSLLQGQLALQVKGENHDIMGTINGTVHAGSVDIAAVFEVSKTADSVDLSWSIAEIDLSQIATVFLSGAALPPELPIFSFKDVKTTVTPKTGAFSFEATSANAWEFPAGGGGLSITEVTVTVDRESRDSQPHCAIAISSDIAKDIVDGLTIADFKLDFDFKGQEWSVAGTVDAAVAEATASLVAAYSQKPEGKTLTLTAQSEMQPVNLGSIGNLSLATLELAFTKPSAVEAGQPAALEWSIVAKGALSIPGAIESHGSLSIYRRDGKAGLEFQPEQATATIHLPPSQQATMALDFGSLTVSRTTTATNTHEWLFDASVSLTLSGLNATVENYLPKKLPMHFKASKQSVALEIDGTIEAIQFVIPKVDVPSLGGLSLGTAEIELSTLAISLGQTVELSAVLGVGLPSQLNTLFGVKKDSDGRVQKDANGDLVPSVEFFRTFKPHDPEHTTVQLKLEMSEAGIKVTPETSFINAIELVTENGKTRWHGDFGDYGAIVVDVPEFTYSATTTAFEVSGGFEVTRPLALPLTPIKHLLDACKLSGAAKTLPDALPFSNVKIDANNLVDQLVKMLDSLLERTGGGQLSSDAKKVLDTIGQNFHKLPTSFIDYLDIQIPQSFNFDIAVTPEGAVRFDASVKEGDPPIKLLFPGLMLLMPVLNGITLRSISFGETAGGSLFLLKVDADIDQFDLPTLAAALVLPDIPDSPLPSTQALHRRLRLNDLDMVLPTALPIPIPLFYKNVGIEYLGLEGLMLQAHAQFPMPKPSLKAIGELLSNFKQFFTNSTYRLDPKTPPQGLDPTFFSLHQNSIQLPKYLGGNTLAPQKDPEITYETIASLLNGMKFLTINDLVQAIPLANRIGFVTGAIGPLSANFGWLVTTPDEFRQLPSTPVNLKQIAYQQLGLANDDQATDILTVLPMATANGNTGEQGLVVFMKGGWNVQNVTTFDAAFGLVAAGTVGFNTGFKIAGSLANFVDLKLAGSIAVQGKPGALQASPAAIDLTSHALTFSGQNQYVTLGNAPVLNFTGAITIAAWIKPTAIDGLRNIVAHGYNAAPAGEVYLRILNGQYQVGSWDGNDYFVAAPIPASDVGTWVHLAGVFDGSAWKLYRNGVLVGTQVTTIDRAAVPHVDTVSQNPPTHADTVVRFTHIDTVRPLPPVHVDIPAQPAVHIAIPTKGAFPVQSNWAIGASGSGTERFFQGQIAEVHLWNQARTAAEIQAEMSRPLSGSEPGLVGYWALNEGTGTVVRDRSSNGTTGTIQGAIWSQPPALTASPNPTVQIKGSSLLTIPILNNHQVFKGDVQIVDQSFSCKGIFTLFPPESPLQVSGSLIGSLNRSDFFLSGSVATTLAGFVLQAAKATVSNHRIFVEGTWLGFPAALDVQMANSALKLNGQIGVNAGIQTNVGPLTEPVTGLTIVQSIPLNTRLTGSLNTTISYVGTTASFAAGVTGSFSWNGTSLPLPTFNLTAPPTDLSALQNVLINQIGTHARELFGSFFNTPYKAFRAGFDGTVTLVNNLQPALNAAKRWNGTAWNAVSQWSSQGWKSSYQWNATAWNATASWRDSAWRASTQWSDTAWNATTRWSDDAWNATAQWSDDAWAATTTWTADSWNATTTWSKETWQASTTWTSKVWNSTKTWTVDQFKNPLQTLRSLFHIDTTIPGVNVDFPPHGDTTHADSSSHIDGSKFGIHVDSNPHFDVPTGTHVDTPAVHTDTPPAHTDTPGF